MERYVERFKSIIPDLEKCFDRLKNLDVFSVVAILASILAFVFILMFLASSIKYRNKKKRLTILKNRKNFIHIVTADLKNNKHSMKILDNISIKLCMFNRYSYEKNLENAAVLCGAAIVLVFVCIALFLPSVNVVWYITVMYIIVAFVFTAILFIMFSFIARLRFTSKLPDTYKLLNSRYITAGNILKAIDASMDDFDKAVKREMLKIHNVLKKNDMHEIDETFKRMEQAYKNEYLTLLLNLIAQAHYKGGDAAIKKQFESTTEEILTDIENQKDLSFTARIYMFLALFLPPSIKWLESFNDRALDGNAAAFYGSPLGIQIKVVFYLAFLFYLGILLFMERTA